MQMKALRSRELRKAFFQQLDQRRVLGHVDIGGHAGRILLEPDALHGISPLSLAPVTRRLRRARALFRAVLSNAAADGKRLRRYRPRQGSKRPDLAARIRLKLRGAAAVVLIGGRLGVAGGALGLWAWSPPSAWPAWPAWRAGLGGSAAASGLALACLAPAAGLASACSPVPGLASLASVLRRRASAFCRRRATFLPRRRVVCLSASAATAAIRAAPVLVGPV